MKFNSAVSAVAQAAPSMPMLSHLMKNKLDATVINTIPKLMGMAHLNQSEKCNMAPAVPPADWMT